jgi:hypothetical protein
MVTTSGDKPDVTIDARPIRPTSNKTPWDRALAIRDRITAEIRKTLAQEKLEAAVFNSPNGGYPPWVKLEAWLPGKTSALGTASRERAGLVFTVDAKPYFEHDIVITADLARGNTKIKAADRPEFPVERVSEWVLYALDRGAKPSNYTPRKDAFVHAIAHFLPFIPAPHSNRLQSIYRTWLTAAQFVGYSSLIAIIGGGAVFANAPNDSAPPLPAMIIIACGLAGLVAAAMIARSRKRSVSVTTQSRLPPRNLVLVDSWHAVISELGGDFAKVKQRLLAAIRNDASPNTACQTETYTHQAPNGYEQRDRLVVTRDQGMVHIHLYQFAHDLFVGWYAYLNWAQWGETNPVAVRVHKGQEVEYRDLRPATYVPNQFDLIDLSSLSEFVHRRLEREIKAIMKERDIDQEIDFKVIRGDRDRALDQERHGSGEKKSSMAATWSYK